LSIPVHWIIRFGISLACMMGFTYNPVDLVRLRHLEDSDATMVSFGVSVLAMSSRLGGSEVKMRTNIQAAAVALSAFVIVLMPAPAARAQAAQAANPGYTMPEYNAYQACKAEKDPNTMVKCADDFIAKYPSSTLLQYMYQ